MYDPAVCSTKGYCIPNSDGQTGTCNCVAPYSGFDCNSFITCGGISALNSTVCGGRGRCGYASDNTTTICTCTDPTVYGTYCTQELSCGGVASTDANVCSGHGVCIRTSSSANSAVCRCDAGYKQLYGSCYSSKSGSHQVAVNVVLLLLALMMAFE